MKQQPSPVLLIAFNRPELTNRVFQQIRKARPSKLFLAVDGPREYNTGDIEKVRQVQEMADLVDWPCELKTLFRKINLGCKMGVSSAIDWFFESVDEGIILEDDCLPDGTFFQFCAEMLERFRSDERIGMVCGYNIAGSLGAPYSYIFSRYGHIWGWATWKRAWKNYDVKLELWADKDNQKKIRSYIDNDRQWNFRRELYEVSFAGKKDTWDYQWEAVRLFHRQLSIIPSNNMIENIGFGVDATHTLQASSSMVIPARPADFPLKHDPNVSASDDYDRRLHPLRRSSSKKMRYLKQKTKAIAKKILPPIIFAGMRRIVKGSPSFHPIWNTLGYKPMQGVQLYFDPSGSWQKKMLDGSYDRFLFDRISSMKPEDKIIYDIGAHIGFHSFYFARLVGKNGKVLAFEPNKPNYERIKLILDKNPEFKGMISVYNVAISDTSGTEEFTVNNDIESGRSSGNFIESADPFWSKESYGSRGFTKDSVKTVSMDRFSEELNIRDLPDIIKLDVEGAEYLALKGALDILTSKKPVLFIEIHSMKNMFNVMKLFSEISYEASIIRVENNGVCYLEAKAKN